MFAGQTNETSCGTRFSSAVMVVMMMVVAVDDVGGCLFKCWSMRSRLQVLPICNADGFTKSFELNSMQCNVYWDVKYQLIFKLK